MRERDREREREIYAGDLAKIPRISSSASKCENGRARKDTPWDRQTVTTATVTTKCLKTCAIISWKYTRFSIQHVVTVVVVTVCWSYERYCEFPAQRRNTKTGELAKILRSSNSASKYKNKRARKDIAVSHRPTEGVR